MNAIDRMWDFVKNDLYISKEEFVKSLDGYAIDPEFDDNQQMIGVVIHKGAMFHFMTFGLKWHATKALLAKWPGSLIDKYGYAETHTPLEDERQHRFNRRIGFVETKRDEHNIYYRIERTKSCQPSPG